MQLKTFLSAAFAVATVSAQETNDTATQDLNTVLGSSQNLTSLVSLLFQYPEITEALESAQNVTILAPSNNAIDLFNSSGIFAEAEQTDGLVEAILQYHVLNGLFNSSVITNSSAFVPTLMNNTEFTTLTTGQVVEAVMQDGDVNFYGGLRRNVSVESADIAFSGGIIHIVDNVLAVPGNFSSVATQANLTSLEGALQMAALNQTVADAEQITVFAPTNAAFQNIGSALEFLSEEDLAGILQYHVISDSILYSSDITNTTLPTLQGDNITITVANGSVYVNSARVVRPNILLSNGVMHVIDSVLNPANPATPFDDAAAAANSTESGSAVPVTGSATATASIVGGGAFPDASSASEVPFTSGISTPTTTATELVQTVTDVAADATGEPAPTEGAGGESSSEDAAPRATAFVGAAALFGGAAFMANW